MLKSLDESLLRGCVVCARDYSRLQPHCAVCSYVAALPEIMDLTAVLNSNQRVQNCHLWLTPYATISESAAAPLRNVHRKNEKLRTMESLRKASKRADHVNDKNLASALKCQAQDVLGQESFEAYLPCLAVMHTSLRGLLCSRSNSQFLDRYAIYRFEPMHNIHIGVRKML